MSGGALVLALSSIATLGTWGWHYHRYLLPFFPLVLVFAVVGFCSLTASRRGTWLPGALAGFALLVSLLGLPTWAAIMGGASSQVKEQQVSFGYWIKESRPSGGRVGINDPGAILCYGGHPTVDLIGLTTNARAWPSRNGPGSLYEALEQMPEEKRPDYFAVCPNWFPDFYTSGLFGEDRKSVV